MLMRSSGFIVKAACRGYRPHRFASHKGHQRPHLIARLAKERGIARFIVAPSGYGKTSLALDYAETMFAWGHVFWINAKSPCFIRDLDAGIIAADCREVDADVKLVVIDDVPQLDAARVQALSQDIDSLLEWGCEVVVVCTPSCDLLGNLQVDRVRLGASDLLLTDDELIVAMGDESRSRLDVARIPPAGRVPALVWDTSPRAAAAFAAANLAEDLPADLLLAACGAFALHSGALSDLSEFGPIDVALVADTFGDYPHLGFDVEAGSFMAPLVDADSLAQAAKGAMSAMVERSRFDSRDDLALAWAGTLLAHGRSADRACDLVRAFCPAKRRAAWLLEHARELARLGCFRAVLRLVQSLKGGHCESKDRLLAVEALCLRMLGDEEGAVRCGKRCAFDPVSPPDARIVGLLLVARFAPGELAVRAQVALSEWAESLSGADASAAEQPSNVTGQPSSVAGLPWYDALAIAWAACEAGVAELGQVWVDLHEAQADNDVQCLVASWLFAQVGKSWEQNAPYDGNPVSVAERYVRTRLAAADDASAPPDFFALSAGLSMESAHAKGMPFAEGPLEASILLALRRTEMAMLMQRRDFEQACREARVRRMGLSSEGPLYGIKGAGLVPVERHAVPTLEIKAFGRLDVSIGGEPIDPSRIGRKQSRVLLVLLAANRGRDMSRDVIAQTMWPTSDIGTARKNFYVAWSQVRRALTLDDGTCPYLVRHQYGCRLEERHVKSDIARLDDICRELLFGRLDFDAWYDMYTEVDRDFTGDLMPAEEHNALVLKLRDEYRGRLVDALIAATLRLVDAGNPQWGIWFARSAIAREETREDAYVALMRAQVANGQRTAAMMTYLTCRRVLSDELGIDPSPEATDLYESLLGG